MSTTTDYKSVRDYHIGNSQSPCPKSNYADSVSIGQGTHLIIHKYVFELDEALVEYELDSIRYMDTIEPMCSILTSLIDKLHSKDWN